MEPFGLDRQAGRGRMLGSEGRARMNLTGTLRHHGRAGRAGALDRSVGVW
jgi:hypothetical protein